LYLDNTGQVRMGDIVWKAAAGTTPELSSAAAYALAQGALNRALAGDCSTALSMAEKSQELPQGPVAQFRSGVAAGLCGASPQAERAVSALDQIRTSGTPVSRYGPTEIRVALLLFEKKPIAALNLMANVEAQDEALLLPYLKALAYTSAGEPQQAIGYFESITRHRGAAFLGGSNVYPLAQLGLARALEASGEKAASADAYRDFLALWNAPDQPWPSRDERNVARR
jgi:serine/threonine-protein kinase